MLMAKTATYLKKYPSDKFVNSLNDTLLVNSGKLHTLKRDENIGKLSSEERKISFAEIQSAVLYVVSELPDEVFGEKVPTSARHGNAYKWAAIVIAIAVAGYFIVKSISTDSNEHPVTDSLLTETEKLADTTKTDTSKNRSLVVEEKTETEKPLTPAKLAIEVWTDKGKQPTYTKGDTATIYFSVTQPCYVRLIYQMADSSAVLLESNHRVTKNQINKTLRTPTQFGVGEPFGNELLSAYAQSEPFTKLKTERYGKYDIITSKNLTQAYKETQRGLYKLDAFVKTEIKFVTKEK